MRVYTLLSILLFSVFGYSAALNTQCTRNEATGIVEGLNADIPYTIASVTKVFTTHWALTELAPTNRFLTILHITPVAGDTFDIHIQGSLFPYFDKTFYQFLVGELNRLNIRRINNLTYDENFVYASNMRNNALLAHGNDRQTPDEIMRDLRRDTAGINTNLAALNAKALALENMILPKTLNISIKDIHLVEKKDFRSTPQTLTYSLASTELYRTLKELNRNSHNYASEKIFERLSRKENYNDFIRQRLNLRSEEIVILNGSGYPLYIGNDKFYNKASCRAVVMMMSDLRKSMLDAKLEYKDIMPVAGKDSAADGNSTVTQIYGSDRTNGALIAKTGSVADTIALAGMISTENENLFFHTSFDVEQTPADRENAYTKIKYWMINTLLKDKKKSNLDQYSPKSFMPFDKGSYLQPALYRLK